MRVLVALCLLALVGMAVAIPILPAEEEKAPTKSNPSDMDVDAPRFSTRAVAEDMRGMDKLSDPSDEQHGDDFAAAPLEGADHADAAATPTEHGDNQNDSDDDEDEADQDSDSNDSGDADEEERFASVTTAPTAAPNATTAPTAAPNATAAPTTAPAAQTTAPTTAPANTTQTSGVSDGGSNSAGFATTLSASACYKWNVPTTTSKITDLREDAFAFVTDDMGDKVSIVGGCGTGNHPTGCTTTVNTYNVKSNSWDQAGITVSDPLNLKITGGAYCYDAASHTAYDFGGSRATGADGAAHATNTLGSLKINTATGAWEWTKQTMTGTLPPNLQDATLSCLGGSVVAYGGFNSEGFYNDTYVTSTSGPTKWVWSKPAITGKAPSSRSGHSATRVGSKIYVFGGTNGETIFNDLHVLDTTTWTWSLVQTSNTTAAPSARAFHSAVLMPGNRLFIVGGFNPLTKSYFDDVHILDLNTKWWMLPNVIAGAPAGAPFKKAASVAAGEGRSEIIFFGGCTAQFCSDVFKPKIYDTRAVCGTSCGAHGTYTVPQGSTTAFCKCEDNWTGKFCDQATKCPAQCNNRGECVNGKCHCKLGFGGNDCSTQVCPNDCGGRGRGDCSDTEKRCVCHAGFWGLDCSENACPHNCYGRGICGVKNAAGKNICKCQTGFSGDGCEYWGAATLSQNSTSNSNGTVANTTGGSAGSTGAVYDAGFACQNNCNGHGICSKQVGAQGTVQGVCKCVDGFAGVDCGGECSLHCSGVLAGTCSGASALTVKCQCNEGYRGPGCFERYCARNCSAHGVCSGGQCLCQSPWSGAACEIDTSCSGHGELSNGKCVCKAGWGGLNCDTEVTCAGGCTGHGKCIGQGDVHPIGVCQCDDGWGGATCAERQCPKKCSGNGICKDTGECQCYSGYANLDCSRMLECPNNCTGDHGTCMQNINFPDTNKGICKCQPQWAGDSCNDIGCPYACYGRGKCISGKCDCEDGYSGPSCETMCPKKCSGQGLCIAGACKCYPGYGGADCNSTRTCPGVGTPRGLCSGNGVCFAASGKCFCQPGFTGPACAQEHTCGEQGCGQHGKCANSKCYCDPGWEGDHCDKQSQCPNDCGRRGICQRGKCFCFPGFSGEMCEVFTSDNTCPGNCTGKGICQFGQCNCVEGHAGPDCSVITGKDKCKQFPTSTHLCEGRGLCRFAKCFCDPGFAGEHCEKEESCPAGCVKGQGSCRGGKCFCNPGFKGIDCSEDLVCEGTPLPCSGNGVCIQGTCSCLPGYGNSDCSKVMINQKACPGNCSSNGVCHMGRCFCVKGYHGSDCSTVLQNTCPNNCGGHGVCRMGQCFCEPGYAGASCNVQVSCSQRCLENGVCAYGKCFCVPGWHGEDCTIQDGANKRELMVTDDIARALEVSQANRPNKNDMRFCAGGCGLNGLCFNNTCYCSGPHYGPNCKLVRQGPIASRCSNNCGGKGTCILNKCYCNPGYSGAACEKVEPFHCLNNCNNNGRCHLGQCICDAGFEGFDCSKTSACPAGCYENGHGVCLKGTCQCVKGFSGPACNQTNLPRFQEVESASSSLASILGSDECDSTCGVNGLCVNKQCYCKPGFSGTDCSKVTPAEPAAPSVTDELQDAIPTVIPSTTPESHPVSYFLIASVSFAAGALFCVIGQMMWAKHQERKKKEATTKLLRPLLHSIDT